MLRVLTIARSARRAAAWFAKHLRRRPLPLAVEDALLGVIPTGMTRKRYDLLFLGKTSAALLKTVYTAGYTFRSEV